MFVEVNELAPQLRPAALQRAEALHRAGRLSEAIGFLGAVPSGAPKERVPLRIVEMGMRMRRYAASEKLLLNYLAALQQLPLPARDPGVEGDTRELLVRLLFETGRYGPASR